MRALFSFDEAMSPAAFSLAFQIVAGFIGLFALLGAFAALTTLNTPSFFNALLNAAAVIGAGLAVLVALRLMGEIWMAQLRIQDRLNLLVDQGKERRI